MKKSELIENLRAYKGGDMQGDYILAMYFAEWFTQLPENWTYDEHSITGYLPQLFVRACDDLTESSFDHAMRARVLYKAETDERFGALTCLSYGTGVEAAMTRHAIGRIIRQVTGSEHVAKNVLVLLEAECNMLTQAATKFVQRVFSHEDGMYGIFQASEYRGLEGVFGDTTVLKYDIAGRFMMTFSRDGDGIPGQESLTLIWEDGMQHPTSVGIQSTCCKLETALAMLREVEDKWRYADTVDRQCAFRVNSGIGIG